MKLCRISRALFLFTLVFFFITAADLFSMGRREKKPVPLPSAESETSVSNAPSSAGSSQQENPPVKDDTFTLVSETLILSLDSVGCDIEEGGRYRWTRSRSTDHDGRLWAFNSENESQSTISFSIKTRSEGNFRLFVTEPPLGFELPGAIEILNGRDTIRLTPAARSDSGGWYEYGSGVNLSSGISRLIIGNGLPRPAKDAKVSFEALRLEKTEDDSSASESSEGYSQSYSELLQREERKSNLDPSSYSGNAAKTVTFDTITDVLYENGIYYDDESIRYHTGDFDPRALSVPKRIRWGFFDDFINGSQALADYLGRGAENEYHLAKRIHDFLIYNMYYDMDQFYKRELIPHTNTEIHRNQRGVCANFAYNFKWIADAAGIEAYAPTGRVKGGEGHAWSAVRINNKIYIIDCTWDGSNKYDRGVFTTRRQYKDTHLFLRPEAKILSSLALDEEMQFITNPIEEWEFGGAVSHSLNAFERGINVTAEKVSHFRSRSYTSDERLQTSDNYTTSIEPITFTTKVKYSTSQIELRMTRLDGERIDGHTEVSSDGNYTYCTFTPPPFTYDRNEPEKFFDAYSCRILSKDSSKGWNLKTVYQFTLMVEESGQENSEPENDSISLIKAGMNEFILTADMPEAVMTESNNFRWVKTRGTEYPVRYWAYNSDSAPESSIKYRVKLQTPGKYEFSLLSLPEDFRHPFIYIEADGKKNELWPQGDIEGWSLCGKIPLEIKNPEITVTIGNAMFTDERRFKASFEALKIKKVGMASTGQTETAAGAFIAPEGDFILNADSPSLKLTDSPDYRWQRERGIGGERFVVDSTLGESTATIEFDLRMPGPGMYRFSWLVGRDEMFEPELRLESGGYMTIDGPGKHINYTNGDWSSADRIAVLEDDLNVHVTIGNSSLEANRYNQKHLKTDHAKRMFFEALRVERLRDIEYDDRVKVAKYKEEHPSDTTTAVAGYTKTPRTPEQLLSKWRELRPRYEGPVFAEAPQAAPPYRAGEVEPEYLQDCINFLNFLRYTAGYPGDCVLTDSFNEFGQAAAVVNAANNSIEHYPARPANMDADFYEAGSVGSRNNLLLFSGPFHTAPLYLISDVGEENLGHRVSILYAYASGAAFGFAVNDYSYYAVAAMSTPISREVFKHDFFSWPPEGAFPTQFLQGYHSNALWSVDLGNNYNFNSTNAHRVKVELSYIPQNSTYPEKRWSFDQLTNDDYSRSGDYFALGTNSVVRASIAFRPGNLANIEPMNEGDRFIVKITGLRDKNNNATELEYEIELVELSHSYTFYNNTDLPTN